MTTSRIYTVYIQSYRMQICFDLIRYPEYSTDQECLPKFYDYHPMLRILSWSCYMHLLVGYAIPYNMLNNLIAMFKVYSFVGIQTLKSFLYVCMFVCLYVCMFVCLYVCMFVCLYVCMFVCLYVCTLDLFYYFLNQVKTCQADFLKCLDLTEKQQLMHARLFAAK